MADNRASFPSRNDRFPEIRIAGSAHDCGKQLGYAWREALTLGASSVPADSKPFWFDRTYAKLLDRFAPHLPDLYRGMATGANLPDTLVGSRLRATDVGGCTSWALAPDVTLDRHPISGQTKDTSADRLHRYQVLAMNCTDAPSALSLTYPGWFFGHGFVAGGCAIFRNNLYAGATKRGIPYAVFGLLALHCPTVEHVADLAKTHGIAEAFHATIADTHGGIIGIESTAKGIAILKPTRGIYVHANAVINARRAAALEREDKLFKRADSVNRVARMRERLTADRKRLTSQLAMAAMTDHGGYPTSVCRHQSEDAFTTAAIVTEPTKGLLHCTKGQPCRNTAHTYRL